MRTRLERATHLLAHTDEAVTHIAKRIGYRSRTSFARLFKERLD